LGGHWLASLVDIDNSSRGGLGDDVRGGLNHDIAAAVSLCVAVMVMWGKWSSGSSHEQCRGGDDAELHDCS
jgi:hypothetical protein